MLQHLTLEQKQRVVALHKDGCGCTTISKKLSISESHINRVINRYLRYGEHGLFRLPSIHHAPSFKVEVIQQLLQKSLSLEQVALQYQISPSTVHKWVQQVNLRGYDSLFEIKPRGRPPKDMGRQKKIDPQTELEKLRYEVEYLRTENALLKKVKALVQERIARESGKTPKPSKN